MLKNLRQVELINLNLITHSLITKSIQDRGGSGLPKIKLTTAKILHKELRDYFRVLELEDSSIRSQQLLLIITRDLTICNKHLISIREEIACRLKKQRTQMLKKRIPLHSAQKTPLNLKIQE